MSVTALLLLLVAAFTHAGWNFFSKKEHPTLAFYLLANIIGMLSVLPLICFYWSKIFFIPAFVWICLVFSGLFLAGYMAFLAGAYRTGDLSIAYPLARALPVIFITLITTLLMGKTQVISPGFVVGIILVTGGCLILPLRHFSHFAFSQYNNLSCLLAVMAAVCIAGYTIIDSEALEYFRKLPSYGFNPLYTTLIYMALEALACSFWKGLLVLCSFPSVEHSHRCDYGNGFYRGIALSAEGYRCGDYLCRPYSFECRLTGSGLLLPDPGQTEII